MLTLSMTSPPDISDIAHEIRIPKSRIAVLIGTKGETKSRLQSDLKVTITIDSHEGDVTITGKDAVKCFVAKDIVHAIARGFNPDVALLLLKSDYQFELIDLSENTRNKNDMLRVKGRIIGKEGKTRETIEKTLDVFVSVYGKTIGIIGEVEHVLAARQAVEMLLDGSPHANVYRWIENKRRSLTKAELSNAKVELKEEFKKYEE